jgi:hypothetical protein
MTPGEKLARSSSTCAFTLTADELFADGAVSSALLTSSSDSPRAARGDAKMNVVATRIVENRSGRMVRCPVDAGLNEHT